MGSIVQPRPYPAAFLPCAHPHLRFKSGGALISCIDCPRMWHILMPQIGELLGGVPDVGYLHPTLSQMDTRHSPYEAPRMLRLPKHLPKVAPKPVRRPPVQKVEPKPEPPAKPKNASRARRLLRGKK